MTTACSASAFMKSPLVTWVNSLNDEKCAQKEIKDYSELSSGTLFSKVWLQIDPQPIYQFVTTNDGIGSRIKNLSSLLNNIKAFYENILGQTLVIRIPDIVKIAVNPNDESSSCEEMKVLLLLMLGCAVQCERKEHFIDGIKQLDISVQHSIVECIQKITDNPESVWLSSEWNVLPDEEHDRQRLYSLLVQHINGLVKERHELHNKITDLSLELNTNCRSDSNDSNALFVSSLNIANTVRSDQKSSLIVEELADIKSKHRRVQQELEEKNEMVSELKELLEQSKESCNKLRHENLDLIQEARSVKAYRDEIDVLNERVRKVDHLENEVHRYRDKMNELDFFKSRVDELREDNRVLSETKVMLEEQLDLNRKKADQLPELEAQILKLSAYSDEMAIQKDLDRNKMETFIEEITQLRLDKKSSAEELTKVEEQLIHLKSQMKVDLMQQNGEGNLLEQINNDASKRVLKLELENQRLQSLVENIKNNQKSDYEYKSISSSPLTTPSDRSESNSMEDKVNERLGTTSPEEDKEEYKEEVEVVLADKEVQQMNGKLESLELSHSCDCNDLNDKITKLKEENRVMDEEHKRLQTEYKMLQNIYKKLRTENNDLKLRHTELQGETSECRDRMALLDVEVSKLANYCEMVALTNNSIESHRKRLINNISNLLTQYHDVLTEIGGDSEKLISDKMHDLTAKKEKLDKMIKEYDLTLEKKKVVVSNHNVVRRIHRSSTDLCLSNNQIIHFNDRSKERNSAPFDNLADEAIYGRIWEAETPPITSSTSALRPTPTNNTSSQALEQSSGKASETIKASDPLNQIKEEIINGETSVICPVPPPRPPPRVSTTIENKIHLSVITSPLRSQSNTSTGCEALHTMSGSTRTNSHSYNNFTRGTFKSNSINYGSPVRRQHMPYKNGNHHTSHHFHHLHPHSASPSLLSDSSLTPLEDSELSDGGLNNQRSRHLTNCDTVTVNSNTTNSIWYEYGCV
ncbi:unnamed protein product [Medioppia subpectinata]|uniref:HOOK N-terminal domain-containing protein n=1 Tax=Medioppia subpectinata TaxID=1979941 RepID=A0A7R9KDX9_9ACAR|nr:unnamed protein product [Medioppia subpectinata]CAG2101544.1 unnamed protein product [Medioppia subpectinata]